MRTITISTDVFAAIWASRKDSEESEDDILRRILEIPRRPPAHSADARPSAAPDGFRDPRFGVHFAEGQEIFRIYKGVEYVARATRGQWQLMNDKRHYPSLHKLSRAVVEGHENSWMNWKYRRADGSDGLIDELRDPSKVRTRTVAPLKLEDI